MKWLIWSPAIVITFLAFVVPGGLVLFGLPLLALGYLLIAGVALGGRNEHGAAKPARPVGQSGERTFDLPTERSPYEKAA